MYCKKLHWRRIIRGRGGGIQTYLSPLMLKFVSVMMRMMTSRMTLGSLLHSFMPLMLGITWRCLAAWCRCWHNSEARSSSAIQFSTLRANRMGSYCGTRSEETTVSYRPLSDTTLALYPCCCARFNLKPCCHQRCHQRRRVSSWLRGSRKKLCCGNLIKVTRNFFSRHKIIKRKSARRILSFRSMLLHLFSKQKLTQEGVLVVQDKPFQLSPS